VCFLEAKSKSLPLMFSWHPGMSFFPDHTFKVSFKALLIPERVFLNKHAYIAKPCTILIRPNIFRPGGCPVQPQFSTFIIGPSCRLSLKRLVVKRSAYGQMEASCSVRGVCLTNFQRTDFTTFPENSQVFSHCMFHPLTAMSPTHPYTPTDIKERFTWIASLGWWELHSTAIRTCWSRYFITLLVLRMRYNLLVM